jgi:hypothetical protein
MCFSEKVSAATFLIGMIGSAIIWHRGQGESRIFALIFAFIVLMQGLEFVLWRNQRCDDWHRSVSLFGSWLNLLQPVAAAAIIWWLAENPSPWIFAVVAGYLAIIVPYLIRYQGSLRCTTPRPGNPHLVWGWANQAGKGLMWTVYLAAFIAIMYLGMSLGSANSFTVVFLASLSLSALFYPRESIGSIWCVAAALVPVGYIVQNKLLI